MDKELVEIIELGCGRKPLTAKELAMRVSNALGLRGEITLDVKVIVELIWQNCINNASKAQKAIESIKIGRYFRQVRSETELKNIRIYDPLIVKPTSFSRWI